MLQADDGAGRVLMLRTGQLRTGLRNTAMRWEWPVVERSSVIPKALRKPRAQSTVTGPLLGGGGPEPRRPSTPC